MNWDNMPVQGCSGCASTAGRQGCAVHAGPLLRPRIVDQPPPVPNEDTPIWDLVIADMKERDQTGRARYGTPLQGFNGRDALVDAYQEVLDLVVYLRQELHEREVADMEAKRVLLAAVYQVLDRRVDWDWPFSQEEFVDMLLAAMRAPAVESGS